MLVQRPPEMVLMGENEHAVCMLSRRPTGATRVENYEGCDYLART